eukprot:scaffold371341_cov37-Prasinocladus_malaysianus.AAC.2
MSLMSEFRGWVIDYDKATYVHSKDDRGTTKRQDMDSVTPEEHKVPPHTIACRLLRCPPFHLAEQDSGKIRIQIENHLYSFVKGIIPQSSENCQN